MRIILTCFLLFASLGFSQDHKSFVSGHWFVNTYEDGRIGNLIKLQRDSCVVNYVSNSFKVTLQTTYHFNADNFNVDSNTGNVLGVAYFYPYWEIVGNQILLGRTRDKLIPFYEIIEISTTKLILKRLA